MVFMRKIKIKAERGGRGQAGDTQRNQQVYAHAFVKTTLYQSFSFSQIPPDPEQNMQCSVPPSSEHVWQCPSFDRF